MIRKIIKISVLILSLSGQSCKNNASPDQTGHTSDQEKKFNWKPTECAPYHYPAEIYHGDFITDDDSYFTIPYGATINYGWGSSGSTWVVGEDAKPVPSRLKIIWLSYTENEFYFLDTALPKQKMTELFEKGFINDRGQPETYDNIVVGLAPGGAVSVWLLAAEHVTEVGHYQAEKTEVAMADFNPDGIQNRDSYVNITRESFSEETKRVIAEQGIPIGKWTNFRQRFLWKPVLKEDDGHKLATFYNRFYNGEMYSAAVGNPVLDTYKDYPPPQRSSFRWNDKNNKRFGAKINFDEKEIWETYKKIFKNKDNKHAELVFTIDQYNSALKITLESEADTIEIKKAKINIYESVQ